MRKINKKEYLLLFVFFGLLIFSPAKGQTPSEVDLTWSTDTYVPLDYPGKALPTRESRVEVVANINSDANAQELIYTWLINDKVQESKSGKGKQTFRFNIGESVNEMYQIKVIVSDKSESFNLSSSYLNIYPIEPELVIETSLQPIEPSSLTKNYTASSDQELEFVAKPYFFNISQIDDLDYIWSFGDRGALPNNSGKPNVFSLKISKLTESVSEELTVWAENGNALLEKTYSTIGINIIP